MTINLNILRFIPLAYALHILEEGPRFVRWTKRYIWLFTSRFDMQGFIIGNIVFMVFVVMSVYLATTYPARWTLVLGLSTASWIFSNFLVHAVLTLISGIYSPGVVTAGALYVWISIYIYSAL